MDGFDIGDLVSAATALFSLLSFSWYLRGQLSRIAVSLASIEAGLRTSRDLGAENKSKVDGAHRRLDDLTVRIAVLESREGL